MVTNSLFYINVNTILLAGFIFVIFVTLVQNVQIIWSDWLGGYGQA